LLTADYQRRFDIPVVFNDAVQYFVRYFMTEKRKVFVNWLRRSKRYVPTIKEILREQGLPEDLVYLAMIESGFNPKAYSSMKACGPWQFIYETGGRYGLRVNHWVDERRDPEKSTVAATLYLKDLFNQFGDWHLAAAGYNAGEKRIERAIEKHETTDFWELTTYNTLPRETREYIPRLLAAAIIAKDPERFGFTDIDYDRSIKFVSERVPGGTSLNVVAKAASTDMLTVRALNPEILTGVTPPDIDNYVIKLPEWIKRDKFREELTVMEEEKRVQQVASYTCKKRDNLATITKKFRVSRDDLLLVNSCDEDLSTRLGKVIFIPRFYEGGEAAKVASIEVTREKQEPTRRATAAEIGAEIKPPRAKVASKVNPRVTDYHLVRRGESLADISQKYGIDQATLREINGLKKNRIYPNMRLELTSHTRKSEKLPTTAAYHTVRKGETLSGIAEKYDMDMERLKTINRMKKGSLKSGMRLKVSAWKVRPSTRG
jgi:membrane-bound lytic murein transglycosylase D